MAHNPERRQFPRTEVKWPAIITVSGAQIFAETEDISEIGTCIYCQALPPLEKEFRLEIQPPNRPSLLVTAKTIWAMPIERKEGPYRFAVGAGFEYIAERDVRLLRKIVDSRST